MAENTSNIIAIELLAAAQGYDFHAPVRSSEAIAAVHRAVRATVPHLCEDRYFHPDITAAAQIVRAGSLREIAESHAIPVPSVTNG